MYIHELMDKALLENEMFVMCIYIYMCVHQYINICECIFFAYTFAYILCINP